MIQPTANSQQPTANSQQPTAFLDRTSSNSSSDLLNSLSSLNASELRRLLVQHLTKQKLGLYWEHNQIERDNALNANLVLPKLIPDLSCRSKEMMADMPHRNLIIEGDNFDSLRLLNATHTGKIRVIYIDPPYNTGNKDWVYNDNYTGANDRWRHSKWLEFMHERLSLARDLLTTDGVIMVSINDENRARLELLMDEVFPGMRLGSLVWRKRRPSNAAGVEHFFSEDHEHVLIYSNEDFEFNGSAKTWSGYKNWDEGKQDWWASADLTLGFNAKERKNLFFPLHNPKTDIWYPCDWNNVWRYASRERLDGREVRTRPMEDWVVDDYVYFPEEKDAAYYDSLNQLKAAISDGKAPSFLDKSDDLSFWVCKKIGFSKPRFKRFKLNLQNAAQPLSSWIAEAGKADKDGESLELAAGMTSEGTKALRNLELDEAFNYPKPPSLIKGLLSQATRPDDIVLDFFAGSGTTGEALLELNAEDNGKRRFILCSSTEATIKEPDKNLCRDVCAERVRRVIQGYKDKLGYTLEHGGEFGYLQLDKVEASDAHFEIDSTHAFHLLKLRRMGAVTSMPNDPIKCLGRAENCDLLICDEVNHNTIKELINWPQQHDVARLAIYCTRPDSLQEILTAAGVEANCYSLIDALMLGQGGKKV